MRYQPSQRLLRLALMLAGTRTGLTLDEMAQNLEMGRRTAERLRNSLADLFPQLDNWDDEERVRRWRLPSGALAGIAEPRAEAVAAVETLARECGARGEDGSRRTAARRRDDIARADATSRPAPGRAGHRGADAGGGHRHAPGPPPAPRPGAPAHLATRHPRDAA